MCCAGKKLLFICRNQIANGRVSNSSRNDTSKCKDPNKHIISNSFSPEKPDHCHTFRLKYELLMIHLD